MKLLFSLITLCLGLFFVSDVLADQIHRVKKGETLYRIAKTHGMSVQELKKTNHLTTSLIKVGQKLHLPSVPNDPDKERNKAHKNVKTNVPEEKTDPVLDVQEDQIHRVKRGETLYRIAKTYGMNVKELKKTNHLTTSLIKIGQKLHVPSPSNKAGTEQNTIEERSKIEVSEETTEPVLAMEGNSQVGQAVSEEEEEVPSPEEVISLNDESFNPHETAEMEEGENPLISFAIEYLGVPYRFGGENPKKGIDCSAFVQWVFQHFDIDLPRTARDQFKSGVRVSKGDLKIGDLQIGDLIFFRTYARFPSHVGIYMGGGKMIHASSRYRKVSITSVDQPYYKKRFIGVVRIQNTPPVM